MVKCVSCGKEMEMGYTIIDNKIYCPECAEKHPVIVEMRKRREAFEKVMDVLGRMEFQKLSGGKKEITVSGRKITEDEYVLYYKHREMMKMQTRR